MLKEIVEAIKMNPAEKKRIDKLYQGYLKTAEGDERRLHKIILNNFVNNKYARNSNQSIDYIWSLYKKERL